MEPASCGPARRANGPWPGAFADRAAAFGRTCARKGHHHRAVRVAPTARGAARPRRCPAGRAWLRCHPSRRYPLGTCDSAAPPHRVRRSCAAVLAGCGPLGPTEAGGRQADPVALLAVLPSPGALRGRARRGGRRRRSCRRPSPARADPELAARIARRAIRRRPRSRVERPGRPALMAVASVWDSHLIATGIGADLAAERSSRRGRQRVDAGRRQRQPRRAHRRDGAPELRLASAVGPQLALRARRGAGGPGRRRPDARPAAAWSPRRQSAAGRRARLGGQVAPLDERASAAAARHQREPGERGDVARARGSRRAGPRAGRGSGRSTAGPSGSAIDQTWPR